MSVSLLAWAKATSKHLQAATAAAAAAPTLPAFHRTACFAASSAAKQHRLIPNHLGWYYAHHGRRSFSSQAANHSQSAAKLHFSSVLLASAVGAGAVALYLGSNAGQPNTRLAQNLLAPQQLGHVLFADYPIMQTPPTCKMLPAFADVAVSKPHMYSL